MVLLVGEASERKDVSMAKRRNSDRSTELDDFTFSQHCYRFRNGLIATMLSRVTKLDGVFEAVATCNLVIFLMLKLVALQLSTSKPII